MNQWEANICGDTLVCHIWPRLSRKRKKRAAIANAKVMDRLVRELLETGEYHVDKDGWLLRTLGESEESMSHVSTNAPEAIQSSR